MANATTPIWQQRIASANQQRQQANQWRRRRTLASAQAIEVEQDGRTLLNFCSNDYLGLANQAGEDLAKAALQWGLGSGASHLVCGHSSVHDELEQALAAHTGYPRALLFSTGFMANLGCINALTQRGDLILQDKLNHASLIDGALLSRADFQRYRHLDYDQLQRQLEQRKQEMALVVSDSIFSMDGDLADVARLSQLCQQQNAMLMIDDAHGLGVLGQHGAGVRDHFDLSAAELPLYIGTLGKALGGFGAFAAGDEATMDYLVQFARPYIYTTALPPAVAAAMLANLERMKNDQLRLQLHDSIRYFRQRASELGLNLMASDSPIQPLMVGPETDTLAISAALEADGIWVTAIRPPTVPEGSSRLRITLTAAHQSQHIDRLLVALDRHVPAEQRL
ncbi:8-amino-7-oxononanoate synthase [Oceanobacter mangrovi]|uniref:8-amino-7-oxononanoate synthase n=1 Tax=Oceanobacter mangrovi TaxID=2862510 RepID=UPI001C8E0F64|nr:8-amino-7-oxononanoate synthase [Oceanobacter mangrovi]